MLVSSEPISPAETHTHARTQSYTHHRSTSAAPAWLLALAHTCVAGAGGPLGRHAVPLQVCVRDGQQVVAVDGAAQARLGVQQAAGVAGGEGHAHVVVGGGQTLLGRDHGQVSVAGAGGGWWCGTGWGVGWQLTQIRCLLIIRSMSSLILRYLSSDSGLWPAESSASMSGLSQPFKPFLRSVWWREATRMKKKGNCQKRKSCQFLTEKHLLVLSTRK